MPGRYRWMYNATGMPGWMRFGFSPGWIGRSPTGLGPCATYMMTGKWPTPPGFSPPQAPMTDDNRPAPGFFPSFTKDQELDFLEEQSKMLSAQLENIRKRIDELKSET